ncbi:Integrase family protein [Pseudomonas coronafaciens pv. garcae]|nr:Integrase family protein [Pseudomonas coronafaciens pv. garcae]RMV84492.1 Integrase protein [Pseudomonas coronafaciens pv. garcae]
MVVLPNGSLEMRSASCIPIMRYPDGRICYFANMFVLELYSQGYSLTNRGGTVKAYMSLLPQVIKYVHNNQLTFPQFTDSRFQHFMLTLNSFKEDGTKPSQNQQIEIICQSLDLLEHVGHLIDQPNFVSKQGVIQAHRVSTPDESKASDHQNRSRSFQREIRWQIENMPLRSDPGHGIAIGLDALAGLKKATAGASSPFLAQRNALLIEIIHAAGSRRGETSPIKVADIKNALENVYTPNCLSLQTLKHGRLEYREIAIPRGTLEMANEYIQNARRAKIRKTIGRANDHGYLFISERTGAPLSTNTITNIFWKLRKFAGIIERAHPHQLRHLYIHEKMDDLVFLLESSMNTSVHSSYRLSLIASLKLMQETGHRSIQGLEHYLDEYYQELVHKSLPDRLALREAALRKIPQHISTILGVIKDLKTNQIKPFVERMLLALQGDLASHDQ